MSAGAQTDWFAQNVPKGKPVQPSDDWFQQNAPQSQQAPAPPGAAQRFAESAGAAVGAPPKVGDFLEGPKELVLHPVESAKLLGSGMRASISDAANIGLARMRQPGLSNKLGGALEYAESGIPFVGPLLVKAGEQLAGGDVAGGLGTTLGTAGGLILPVKPRPSIAEVAAGTRAVGRGLRGTFLSRPGIKAFLEGYRGGPPGPELGSLETTEMPSLEPGVLRVPEPRAALPTDRPGANFSIPREQLPALALRGEPGAADVLRNTGTTILYTPPEGYPGPRSSVALGRQPRPRVVVIRPAAD